MGLGCAGMVSASSHTVLRGWHMAGKGRVHPSLMGTEARASQHAPDTLRAHFPACWLAGPCALPARQGAHGITCPDTLVFAAGITSSNLPLPALAGQGPNTCNGCCQLRVTVPVPLEPAM